MPSKSIFKEVFSKNMLIIFLLGFSSGLPLLLVGGTLKAWLTRENVDISIIGYFTWAGMAYSLKFLWAPLLDRYTLFKAGRRRSWMIVTQVALMGLLFMMAGLTPAHDLYLMAAIATLIAFFSATQDIAIDAYRREILHDEELGLGSSMTMYGYRIAMLISGGVGLGLTDVGNKFLRLSWGQLYVLMAACMLIGLITTLLAPEPQVDSPPPRTLRDAVIDPLKDFLKRDSAWYIICFVLLYKLGDAMAYSLTTPYYIQMGFSNVDIASIAKIFGLASSLIGFFLGGLAIYYIGIYRCLWLFGIAQIISTALFSILTFTGPKMWALTTVVLAEDICTSMASAAFVSFIAAICNRRYTATQYAILSSIATLGRNFFSGFTGDVVKHIGWANFYYLCALIAIPGMLMLFGMRKHAATTA